MSQMSERMANEVFDALVELAGAIEYNRREFIQAQCHEAHECREFRFCGKLGFGGKLWVNGGRVYVNCYSEDMNKSRKRIIKKTNAKLAEIQKKYEKEKA